MDSSDTPDTTRSTGTPAATQSLWPLWLALGAGLVVLAALVLLYVSVGPQPGRLGDPVAPTVAAAPVDGPLLVKDPPAKDADKPAPVITPGLPPDVPPLPDAKAARVKEIIAAVEKYRGLQSKRDVPCGTLDKDGLRKKMLQSLHEELPAGKMASVESGLKAFGFLPETMSFNTYLPELLTSQVGGFYDPRRKYLAIINDENGLLGRAGAEKLGAGMAEKMENSVLAHELTHAVQDQHFNLEKFLTNELLSDAETGRVALVEGDATLVMYDYLTGARIEDMPGFESYLVSMFKDPKKLFDLMPDMPGSKEMLAAPPWLRDTLLFGYAQGLVFCINVRKAGGQKLLDYAFAKDAPRSSEQILHPEKWHTQRDDPVEIATPDLKAELPGWKPACEGQLGEHAIGIFLRETLKDDKRAVAAAAGWGGDRFVVYEKQPGVRTLAWITEWDGNQDAKEFKETAEAVAASKPASAWTIETPRPGRVQVVFGQLDAKERAAVHKKLAATEAKVPENKNIDFAALGIERGAAPAAGQKEDAPDFAALLNDPAMQKMAEELLGGKDGKGLDLENLLNDPAIQKMAEEMLGGKNGKDGQGLDAGKLLDNPAIQKMAENLLGGKDGKDGNGGDMGTMLNDPAVKQMMKNMFSQERPAGAASADGRTYTNETLGFSIRVSDAAPDWKLNPKPQPPLSVTIEGPDTGVQISIASQALPLPMTIESMGPMIELGPKMAVPEYRKLSGKVIEAAGKQAYELQYEGRGPDGPKLRFAQRVFINGGTMIVLSAAAPVAQWQKDEKAIVGTLDSFSFIEAKGGPGAKKAAPEALKE